MKSYKCADNPNQPVARGREQFRNETELDSRRAWGRGEPFAGAAGMPEGVPFLAGQGPGTVGPAWPAPGLWSVQCFLQLGWVLQKDGLPANPAGNTTEGRAGRPASSLSSSAP